MEGLLNAAQGGCQIHADVARTVELAAILDCNTHIIAGFQHIIDGFAVGFAPRAAVNKKHISALRLTDGDTFEVFFNVITGERYKMCTNEFKDMVAGKYGTTPMPIDPAFRKKIIGDMTPVDCRPADLIAPELEKLKAEAAQYTVQEEDVLSYAMFPKVAADFFKKRREAQLGVNSDMLNAEQKIYPV